MVYRYTKAPTQRQLRVSEEIRHALSEVITRNELSDPFFEKVRVTVSQVRISQDLKIATAFLALPDEVDQKAVIKSMNEIAYVIRKLISKKVILRFIPEICFVIDESIQTASEIESILSQIKK